MAPCPAGHVAVQASVPDPDRAVRKETVRLRRDPPRAPDQGLAQDPARVDPGADPAPDPVDLHPPRAAPGAISAGAPRDRRIRRREIAPEGAMGSSVEGAAVPAAGADRRTDSNAYSRSSNLCTRR